MTSPDPSSVQLADRLGVHARVCTVVSSTQLSPNLREVVLAGDAALLAGVPGNDVMIQVGTGTGQTGRRRYSIRSVETDLDTFSLWVATDHEGPGADWARSTPVGAVVDVVGPRGKIPLAPLADWHLFLGDVSALGAFYRLAQSIEAPGQAIFIIEVDDMNDAVTAPFDEGLGVTGIFVERRGRDLHDPAGLLTGLASFEFPDHEGHAYLFGEFNVNRALTSALRDRGFSPEQISAKAYYRSGRANAANGEPERD